MICIFSVCHNTQRPDGGIQLHASDLGYYEIAGIGEPGRETAPYTTCEVPDVVHDRIYIGRDAPDGNRFKVENIDGRKHAQAIVDSVQLGGGAVAVAEGEVPTPEEVAAAKERYMTWLGHQLALGQQLWAETRNPGRIPHFSKVAALALGANVEWMAPTGGAFKKRCDNCDAMVPTRAAWCPTCNFVFDMERAIQGGHLQAIQANAAVIAAAAAAEEPAPEPMAAAGGRRQGRL